jgi:TctA family transporter
VGVSTIIFSGFFANIIMILLGALLVYEGISGLSIVGFASYYGRKISEIQRQNTRIIDVEAEDVD